MTETEYSSDNWASRIGAPAASARRYSHRLRAVGIVLILVTPIAAIGIVALFVTQHGNPTVGWVATFASVGVVAGIIGFALVDSSVDYHGQTIDATVAFLRHRYPDVTASQAGEVLRSVPSFDAAMSGRVTAPAAGPSAPTTMTWTPDIVRPILPGPTESTLVAIHRVIAAVGIAGVIILALVGVAHRILSPRVWYGGWAIVAAVLLVAFAFWLAAITRGRAEFRQGYTTSPTGTQLVGRGQTRPVDAHTSLDFVDGKTGYLLRHSNSVLLTRDVYNGRLAKIRAEHPDARPTRLAPDDGQSEHPLRRPGDDARH